MSAPRKYEPEFRELAVRLYRERFRQGQESKLVPRQQVGLLLDLNPATLGNWVEDVERVERVLNTGPPGPTPTVSSGRSSCSAAIVEEAPSRPDV